MDVFDIFKNLVNKHFIEEHDIAFYEKELDLKPKYLSKIFKKNDEIPPCQILLQKQIEHSQLLLRNTKKTVKEIAYEMNFEDPHYFSRIFKNKTGISPTKYRQSFL